MTPVKNGFHPAARITPGFRKPDGANRDLVDPEKGGALHPPASEDGVVPCKGGALHPPASEGGVVPCNESWYDREAPSSRTGARR